MATLEQIVAYLKRYQSQFPKEALRAQLLKQGVPAADVDRAIGVVYGGTGVTMTFQAPLRRPATPAQPPADAPPGYQPATAPPVAPPSGRAYILIVEDDPMMREMLTERMEAAGYRVASASDAAQSVIQAEGMKLALILSDIQMPGFGTGVDALKRLRNSTAVPANLPVIFITGMHPQEAAKIVPTGDPYVRLMFKPIDWKLLRLYIRDLTGMDRQV